jgi:hypothetical protein
LPSSSHEIAAGSQKKEFPLNQSLDARRIMEILKLLTSSWPIVGLILGVFALLLFRKGIFHFLNKADELGFGGVKVSAKAQEEKRVDTQPQISKAEELKKVFQSPLLTEMETNIKTELNTASLNPPEREEILVKYLASNQIAVAFERTYFLIFGSQLSALQLLASSPGGVEDIEKLRPFYEQAKSKNPEFYGSYSFESWEGFLQGQVLMGRKENKAAITIRGKEFLKYLVDQGYSLKKGG